VTAESPADPRTLIDLATRETIPGLRYGIVGMREGGHRSLRISPHLDYGAAGLGEHIPPTPPSAAR
jgi:FKBP-type peptidyl-prolyl cis-trans isomerase